MKLMMFAELGSTGDAEMSVFHKLFAPNGTKPLRLVSCPTVMPLQVPVCENAEPQSNNKAAAVVQVQQLKLCFIFLPPVLGSETTGSHRQW
jgi:hypothetical protein